MWTQLLMKRDAGKPVKEDEGHPALGPLLLRKVSTHILSELFSEE